MLNSIKLYFRFLEISLRGQMQYRASFIMQIIGQFFMTFIEFVAIWSLFQRFGSIKGWTLGEVAFFYGLVNVSFALSEVLSRGFDTFAGMVKSGDFDRLLLRPRSTVIQIAGKEFHMRRFGRVLQGAIILVWASIILNINWTMDKIILMLFSILAGICIFFGLIVLQATLSFWTIESLEIMNTLTYGGAETSHYPLNIYRKWFRRFFTYIIPIAFVNYFPVLVIIGKADPLGTPSWLGWISPIVGFVFLVVTFRIWNIGVRHYKSTGS